ncbi:STY4528 family pathogenicity island replication protein [Alloalcanivorax xenomutans]|uniref:STY4528 family pathogenicity island replication protein n=1 Tax=Alloalcanivorax xenomutans TaxID=1094342 RepID=UPI003BAA27F7
MSHSTHFFSSVQVPGILLQDHRLTPLERNAWMLLRSKAGEDGTVVASYESLREHLPCAPGGRKASHETVSKVMLCLRLPTWIALVEHRRDPVTGYIKASRYAVRSEPISFVQACEEDKEYLMQFERALEHTAANVRHLARCILDEAQVYEDLDCLPKEVQDRIANLWEKAHGRDSGGSGGPPSSGGLPVDNSVAVDHDNPKPSPLFPETVRTVQNKVLNKIHTYTYCTDSEEESEVPISGDLSDDAATRRFQRLPLSDQRYLTQRLRGLSLQQRQEVLNEWHRRCTAGYVKNAIAYLYGLIKKAVAGQLRLWAAREPMGTTPSEHVISAESAPVSLEPRYRAQNPKPRLIPAQAVNSANESERLAVRAKGQAHLAQLRAMFDKPRSANQVLGELERSGLLSNPHDDDSGTDYELLGAT